ncbi:transketolase C-terminal domain-containing protein, partial [Desulfovibrio sp.]|uniref:transketolase C-terminal domain-containing protein n=1 Tax=Desulfovibrio sp. TaxID=885 RepID=UPI0023BD0ED0
EAAARIEAETGTRPLVFDPVWLKPLPEDQLAELARNFDRLLFVEEGARAGGFASAALEYLSDARLLRGQRIRRLGLDDTFVEHGTQAELRGLQGLDVDGVTRAGLALLRGE